MLDGQFEPVGGGRLLLGTGKFLSSTLHIVIIHEMDFSFSC